VARGGHFAPGFKDDVPHLIVRGFAFQFQKLRFQKHQAKGVFQGLAVGVAVPQFHARRVGELAADAGYSAEEIARVEALITKRELRNGDPDGQALEDALCLVALETQFLELKSKTPDDKMRDIVLKTWRKMSSAGHTAALTLPLDPQAKTFLEKTFATPSSPSV
jgi:hypothetical protein